MKIIYCNDKFKPKRKSRKSKENIAKKFKKEFTPLKKELYTQPSIFPEIKSIETDKFNTGVKAEPRYEDVEFAARESAAQLEIEKKKKCVAPICNKSGYFYVAEFPDELVKNLGRKI